MALIIYVIFICTFSSVLCNPYECGPGLSTYVPWVLGTIIFIMLIVIIYLSFLVYKHTKVKVSESIITIKDYRKSDTSTQTLDSDIIEIKEINTPEIGTHMEVKTTPTIVKKPLSPGIPIIQKQQMDNIIQEVLNRKNKLGSGKGSVATQDILEKSKSLNKLNECINDSCEIKYKDSAIKDESNSESTNLLKENDEVYDTLPISATKCHELYDTVPNRLVKSCVALDIVNEVYDTFPDSVQCDEIYDILPKPAVKCDEINKYNNLPNPSVSKNPVLEKDASISIPVYDIVPSGSKRENIEVIIDKDTNYTLLIADETRQQNNQYVNANDVCT